MVWSSNTPNLSDFNGVESAVYFDHTGSLSGVSSARRVARYLRSCRISSCAIARCLLRWLATPYWRRMEDSVWNCAQWSAVSPPWPLSPRLRPRLPEFSDRAGPVWAASPTCFLADEKHSHCLTEQVYLPTIVCGVWSGIWAIPSTLCRGFYPVVSEFQRAASSRSRRIGSKAS